MTPNEMNGDTTLSHLLDKAVALIAERDKFMAEHKTIFNRAELMQLAIDRAVSQYQHFNKLEQQQERVG